MVLSFVYWSLRRLLELVVLRFRSEREKEIEILLRRHQLRMLQRQVARPALTPADRALLAALTPSAATRRVEAVAVRDAGDTPSLAPGAGCASLDVSASSPARTRAGGTADSRQHEPRPMSAADRDAGGAVWVPARSPPHSRSTQTVLAASLIPSPTNSPSRAGRSSYGRQPVNFAQDVGALRAFGPLVGFPGFAPVVVRAWLESAGGEKRVHLSLLS